MNTKFLGLQIDNHVNWKSHIEEMIPKLRGTCYAARSMVLIRNINILKSIYYAYSHSFMKYGIILWANLPEVGNFHFTKENRIMAGAQPRTSCRSLFKEFEILLLPCHYILSLMKIIINNQEIFEANSSIHSTNTRNRHHFIDQIPIYLVFKNVYSMLP